MNGGLVVVRRKIDQMTVRNLFKKIVNSLSLLFKAWVERAEKSANWQYSRN